MLTPKQLREVVETMQPALDGLNRWIVRDIARRVAARVERQEAPDFTSTDIRQTEIIRALSGHYDELEEQIRRFTDIASDELKRIFRDAGLTAYEADASVYRRAGVNVEAIDKSPRMKAILEDAYQRTNGELRNLTRTTAVATQRELIKELDKAHMLVMSNATSYARAYADVIDRLAEHQAHVVYPTGHVDTLETAVLRAVRTGTAQASGNMSVTTMEQYGWDIVLTSAHLGARYGDGGENPGNHYWWQGRFFSRSGKDKRFPPFIESTGYGTGEGLSGWNCRHSFGPGDGEHNPWTQYDSEENKAAYDLSQQQRKKERDIRDSKLKLEALDAAVETCADPETRNMLAKKRDDERARLKRRNREYGEFCDDNGLKRQAFRLKVARERQNQQ